jgi:FixJ family two-component response regulator
VFLTGHAASHPLVQQAHKAGLAEVLAKPITPEQLQALLKRTRS